MEEFYRLNLGVTNVYLLKAEDGYLLIDTSYPGNYERLLDGLRKAGVELSSIRYLFLTHHHDDHAGFAAKLIEQTGCQVIAHQDSVEHLARGVSLASNKPLNSCIKALSPVFKLLHPTPEYPPLSLTENDLVLAGDDSRLLKEIGVDGVIIHTPGHTDDSMSLVLSDGSAFVGDAAVNMFLVCTGYRPFVVEDVEEVHKSWRKLRDYGARLIYPAHGKSFPIERLGV